MASGSSRVRTALRVLRSVRDDESAAGAACVNTAQCLLQLGEPEAALTALDRAFVLGAKGWKLSYVRAEALESLNEVEKAVSEAISCVETAPHETATHNLLLRFFGNHLRKTAAKAVTGLQTHLPLLATDPRECSVFLARATKAVTEYEEAVTRLANEGSQVISDRPWHTCIECWRTAIMLGHILRSLEGQMVAYDSPMTQERIADHVRNLLVPGRIPSVASLRRGSGSGDIDELEKAPVPSYREGTRVAIRFVRTPASDVTHLRRLIEGHPDSRQWKGGLELRLLAGHATLARRFHELKSIETSNIRIYHHQVSAALRVLRQCGDQAVLADEVGLGKTIEAGLLLKEYKIRGLVESALVVVPPTLSEQWRQEMSDKFGLRFVVWSPSWHRVRWESEQMVIASMHSLKRPEYGDLVASKVWDMLIVDEAHHARRPASQAWALVNRLRAKRRLLLTATPVHNSMRDLYALVNLAKPGTFHSYAAFQNDFVDEHDPSGRTAKNTPALRRLLSTVLIRTRRVDTTMELPPRQVLTKSIELTSAERAVYEEVTRYVRRCLRRSRTGRRDLSLYTLQRELCSSPAAAAKTLQVLAARPTNSSYRRRRLREMADHCETLRTPAKWHAVDTLIQNCEGEKVIIYTEFRRTAESLVQFLKGRRRSAVLLCGKSDKMAAIDHFRGAAQILVATEVGTEGLNLQFCRNVVNFDFPWNPMRVEQRIGRVHRMDQTRSVRVYNLVIRDTIEDYVVEVLEKKLRLFQLLVGEAEAVLGMMLDRKSFEAEIHAILAGARDDEEMRREIQRYGERIAHAHAELEVVKYLSDSMVIPLPATAQ